MGTVLIVDDEEHIRDILQVALAPVSSRVLTADSAESARELLRDENVDVVVTDLKMPGMDGLEFIRTSKEEQPHLRFCMITAHGTMDTVIQAMRLGAADFVTKPFENVKIREIVQRLLVEGEMRTEALLEPIAAVHGQKSEANPRLGGIIGESDSFLTCLNLSMKAAKADSSVLLLGESGTGKEVLARAIHDQSPRSKKAFIPVNCGAIPENLMEAELFGYEKGAFTGAISSKPGKVALADGGTLFLDEIGELPLSMQVKLLRVLQEKAVDPVGGGTTKKVDFRLLTATHRNLKEDVKQGRFREDLFYRLNIIPIQLPSLREREGDVVLLANYFLMRFNERYSTSFVFEKEDLALLKGHRWPGNIRELENVVERAVVLGQGTTLALDFPQDDSVLEEKTGASIPTASKTDSGIDLKSRKASAEKDEILKALELYRWNKTKTAAELDISRRSLLYKIKEYGIS